MQTCADNSRYHVLRIIHSGIPQNLQLLLEVPSVLKVAISVKLDFCSCFFFCLRQLINYCISINRKFDGDAMKVLKIIKYLWKVWRMFKKLGGDLEWGLWTGLANMQNLVKGLLCEDEKNKRFVISMKRFLKLCRKKVTRVKEIW